MSSDAYEASLELQIGLVEALDPDPSSASYPFPELRTTGQSASRMFRTVVLENEWISATIVPSLGGRILSILDKRTGAQILPAPTRLSPIEGGTRGVAMPVGIQLELLGEERRNGLGAVDLLLQSHEDEADPANVWICESSLGPLSFHWRISLPADRAEIEMEARIFNRSLREQHYNGGLSFGLTFSNAFKTDEGVLLWSGERNVGLAVRSEEMFPGLGADGQPKMARFERSKALAPHQLDTWQATVTPLSGLDRVPNVGAGVSAVLKEDKVQISVSQSFPGSKVLLLQKDGATLEASFDLTPQHVVSIELPEAQRDPVALLVRGANKKDWVRVDKGEHPKDIEPLPSLPGFLQGSPTLQMSRSELQAFGFPLQQRSIAHYLLGVLAQTENEPRQADEEFERALLFNAEDHLSWWAKAAAKRLANEIDGELSELLNAHFLAPLEPILRAEGFLAQQITPTADPNPLLKPLEEIPENFVEVACLLIECGLLADANRWIDEAIRHVDLPMLRYLHAYCFLVGTRLDAEAAEHVAAAARLSFGPPFPWRMVERKALGVLAERFPGNERLQSYGELVKVL